MDRLGASMKKHQEKLLFWKGDTKESDRIPAKKEPCLTPTLMDEGQVKKTLIQPKMGV